VGLIYYDFSLLAAWKVVKSWMPGKSVDVITLLNIT
jgi:hypothetical protein